MNFYQYSDSTDDNSLQSIEQQQENSLHQQLIQNLESHFMEKQSLLPSEVDIFRGAFGLKLAKRQNKTALINADEMMGILSNTLDYLEKLPEASIDQKWRDKIYQLLIINEKQTQQKLVISELSIENFIIYQSKNATSLTEFFNLFSVYLSKTMKNTYQLNANNANVSSNDYSHKIIQNSTKIFENKNIEKDQKKEEKDYKSIIQKRYKKQN